jgi:hypothetical protein
LWEYTAPQELGSKLLGRLHMGELQCQFVNMTDPSKIFIIMRDQPSRQALQHQEINDPLDLDSEICASLGVILPPGRLTPFLSDIFQGSVPYLTSQRLVSLHPHSSMHELSEKLWQGGKLVLKTFDTAERIYFGKWAHMAAYQHGSPPRNSGRTLPNVDPSADTTDSLFPPGQGGCHEMLHQQTSVDTMPCRAGARHCQQRPTTAALQRALQRKSYCIGSLQKKLDAQRAENFLWQASYKKLQAILASPMDAWREMLTPPVPILQTPAMSPTADHPQPTAPLQCADGKAALTSAGAIPSPMSTSRTSVSSTPAQPRSSTSSPGQGYALSPTVQSTTERNLIHTCAPPPGWTTQQGITVPPSQIRVSLLGEVCNAAGRQEASSYDSLSADGPDSAIWLCILCQMDQPNAYPDFEVCHSCQAFYHFRASEFREHPWTCLRCRMRESGSPSPRVCHHCHQEEESRSEDAPPAPSTIRAPD